jgi:hypothetical protein
MVLRLLRIAAGIVMLVGCIHATDVFCVEYKYGKLTQRSLKHTALHFVSLMDSTLTYFCVAGLLYAVTDVVIRRQDSRDPNRADYREPTESRPA